MVIRRNCWKLGSVHHPALRDRSAVCAVYFQLKVYMVVKTPVFRQNLFSQGQEPGSRENLKIYDHDHGPERIFTI